MGFFVWEVEMRFGKVRSARLSAGVPLAALAQETGRSISYFYALERGLTTPTRPDAEKIAQVLGVPVEELFERVRESTGTVDSLD